MFIRKMPFSLMNIFWDIIYFLNLLDSLNINWYLCILIYVLIYVRYNNCCDFGAGLQLEAGTGLFFIYSLDNCGRYHGTKDDHWIWQVIFSKIQFKVNCWYKYFQYWESGLWEICQACCWSNHKHSDSSRSQMWAEIYRYVHGQS